MAISTTRHWESMGGAVPDQSTGPEPIRPDPASNPRWYALQIRCQFEKTADSHLRRKGIETFLPLIRQTHRWSDRQKVVEVPLFPGYEFVHVLLSAEVRGLVLRTPGVVGFVGPQQGASSVPSSQIDALRLLLDTHAPCTLRPFLRTGQRVRVRNGSLDGLEGILQSSDSRSLVISIDCIERSVAVTIEGYDLEAV